MKIQSRHHLQGTDLLALIWEKGHAFGLRRSPISSCRSRMHKEAHGLIYPTNHWSWRSAVAQFLGRWSTLKRRTVNPMTRVHLGQLCYLICEVPQILSKPWGGYQGTCSSSVPIGMCKKGPLIDHLWPWSDRAENGFDKVSGRLIRSVCAVGNTTQYPNYMNP